MICSFFAITLKHDDYTKWTHLVDGNYVPGVVCDDFLFVFVFVRTLLPIFHKFIN